jgi:hypothetical protein
MSTPMTLAAALAAEVLLAWVIPGAWPVVPLTVVGVGVRLADPDPVAVRPRAGQFDKDL